MSAAALVLALLLGPSPAVDARLAEGTRALAAGDGRQALQAFEAALREAGPCCAACRHGQALAFLQLGRPIEAGVAAQQGLPCAEGTEAALLQAVRGEALLAQAGRSPDALKGAEQAFAAAAEADPAAAGYRLRLAVALLKQSRDAEGRGHLEAVLAPGSSLSDEERALARQLLDDPRRARLPVAPGFEGRGLDGVPVSLAALAGKVVVVDFWATWCPPCVAAVGELKELRRQFPRDLVVVGISADEDEEAWRAFVARHGMEWPQLRDPQAGIGRLYGAEALPTYVVVDAEGFVRARLTGTTQGGTLRQRLAEVLAGLGAR